MREARHSDQEDAASIRGLSSWIHEERCRNAARDQLARELQDGPVARIQAAQPSEIQLRLEELEKALHALREESRELEGVLRPVLASEAASAQAGAAFGPQECETDLGQRLQHLIELARSSDHALRSMRARCRL